MRPDSLCGPDPVSLGALDADRGSWRDCAAPAPALIRSGSCLLISEASFTKYKYKLLLNVNF